MISPVERRPVDPEYFSLGVRRAMHEMPNPEEPEDVQIRDVDGSEMFSLLPEESASLMEDPEVIEAGAQVAEAEAAVMRAEDAGTSDEIAMYRLDRARAEERTVLVRLQKARTVAHTERVESRAARVVALRPRPSMSGGEAA